MADGGFEPTTPIVPEFGSSDLDYEELNQIWKNIYEDSEDVPETKAIQVQEENINYQYLLTLKRYNQISEKCRHCKSKKPIMECICSFKLDKGCIDPYPVCIFPRIYLGSARYLKDNDFLISKNIGFILNCAYPELLDNLEENDYNKTIEKLTLNALDDDNYPIINLFGEKSYDFICDALEKSEKNIYIHCQMGFNRSATIAAYCIWKLDEERTMINVINSITKQRPCTFSNHFFIRHLLGIYEEKKKIYPQA
jgi:protein-tyrosine phosphatase